MLWSACPEVTNFGNYWGKHTVSIKDAIHFQSIFHLKTGLKMNLRYQADYLHRSESHYHIYSIYLT